MGNDSTPKKPPGRLTKPIGRPPNKKSKISFDRLSLTQLIDLYRKSEVVDARMFNAVRRKLIAKWERDLFDLVSNYLTMQIYWAEDKNPPNPPIIVTNPVVDHQRMPGKTSLGRSAEAERRERKLTADLINVLDTVKAQLKREEFGRLSYIENKRKFLRNTEHTQYLPDNSFLTFKALYEWVPKTYSREELEQMHGMILKASKGPSMHVVRGENEYYYVVMVADSSFYQAASRYVAVNSKGHKPRKRRMAKMDLDAFVKIGLLKKERWRQGTLYFVGYARAHPDGRYKLEPFINSGNKHKLKRYRAALSATKGK